MSTLPRTRSTLLGRLRDIDNQDAWEEFVETYGPRVFDWCCRFNLQPADAADVTQNVLTRLCKAMQTFRYDKSRGSFRSWLKTVTANAARDFLSTLSKPDRGTGDSDVVFGLDALRDPDAIEDLASVLEAEAERELVREAEERVKLRIKPQNWDAWRLTVHENMSADQAADRLGLRPRDIYVARSRVTKMLRDEVAVLNRDPMVSA